jgi:hypothetical protein
MKKYSSDSGINAIVRQLVKEGWRYKRGGKHGKVISPARAVILTVPTTPSDWRASRQFRADLRRRLRFSGDVDNRCHEPW